jgi:SAM-dependent methyltransferase
MVYIDPSFAPAVDSELYQPNYYRKMRGLSRLIERLLLQERRALTERYVRKGRLLDIGCGTGEFLRTMSLAGWDAIGVEPSPAATSYTEGLNIVRSDLKKAGFPVLSFDAITLWHVLEHLPDPIEHLKDIHSLLRNSGILVVCVPNIDSLQSCVGGSNWFPLELPRHKWHFSPSSITAALDRAGFRIKKIHHISFEYGPFCWWQTLFNIVGCEPSFVYKVLKRGELRPGWWSLRRHYTVLVTITLGIPFLALAMILSILEALVRRGGIITVIAVKKEWE